MQVKCNLAIQAQRQNEKEYNILFHFASASSTSFSKAQQRGTQREAREVETSKKPWTHFNFFTTYHKYPPKSDCEQLGMRQILPNTQQDLTWGWGGEVWGWLCWITWGGSAHYPIFLQGVPPPPRGSSHKMQTNSLLYSYNFFLVYFNRSFCQLLLHSIHVKPQILSQICWIPRGGSSEDLHLLLKGE